MTSLSYLQIQPSPLTNDMLAVLNGFIKPELRISGIISQPGDVAVYFANIAKDTQFFSFDNLLRHVDAPTMQALMAKLKEYPVTEVKCYNALWSWDDDTFKAFGAGLSRLPGLITLDVSRSAIASRDWHNPRATIAFSRVLSQVKQIKNLVLSNNYFGDYDRVNNAGTLALAEALGQMDLITLDLSGNRLGIVANSTQVLLKGLSFNKRLTLLDVSHNSFGTPRGADAAVQSLAGTINKLPRIVRFDASFNDLGLRAVEGMLELATALANRTNLAYVNLASNRIGTHGKEAPVKLVEMLFKNQQLVASGNFDFAGLENAPWVRAAEATEVGTIGRIKQVCLSEYCHGSGSAAKHAMGSITTVSTVDDHLPLAAPAAAVATSTAFVAPQTVLTMADYAAVVTTNSSAYFNGQTITAGAVMPHIVLAVFCGALLYQFFQKLSQKLLAYQR